MKQVSIVREKGVTDEGSGESTEEEVMGAGKRLNFVNYTCLLDLKYSCWSRTQATEPSICVNVMLCNANVKIKVTLHETESVTAATERVRYDYLSNVSELIHLLIIPDAIEAQHVTVVVEELT